MPFLYPFPVYESNEPVYFDNLNVRDTRGRIIEEDHYYAYGLKIAAISSTKISDPNEGNIDNKNLYNDKELLDDADLDWYDYGFRSYDAQIGRFPQLDPLTDNYPELTPYQYGSCEPIANIDVDGLEGANILAPVTVTSFRHLASAVSSTGVGTALVQGLKAAAGGITGLAAGVIDNVTGFSNIRGSMAQNIKDPYIATGWNAGLDVADVGSMIGGAVESNIGRGMAAASIVITGGTGGLSIGVSGWGIIGGGGMALHGVFVMKNAGANLISQRGRVHVEGKNGETSSTKRGKDAHNQYDPGNNYQTRRQQTGLNDGKYPDAIDYDNKIVRELKPNNARKIKEGTDQVGKYAQQLQKERGGKWKVAVDTYDTNADGSFTYHYDTPH